MNNYLAKPVRAQTLRVMLESYLNKEGDGKEIPNLAAEAKKLVKQALKEADTVDSEPDGGTKAKKPDGEDVSNAGKLGIRSRPQSLRKITAQRIRPVDQDETRPPS